jgi:hypothetical protein
MGVDEVGGRKVFFGWCMASGMDANGSTGSGLNQRAPWTGK